MKRLLYIPVLMLLLFACTTPKNLKTFKENNLIFGSGGGFTNINNAYSLTYDGRISKINEFSNESIPLTKISKKESKRLFVKFLKSGLDTLEYSKPGNMYYFLGFEKDTNKKKIIWGSKNDVPSSVNDLYKELTLLIKK